eukprot:TRINITY_DN10508_c0_g2_i1.p1 TRINITY_DN10508_c0_g2~~TRINITY_DN10508_c0_g2_i1.p1  ORF type:complete len:456 (+),score=96.70 TRINITY_DN10508_c0_g2_i1:62-1429(+)
MNRGIKRQNAILLMTVIPDIFINAFVTEALKKVEADCKKYREEKAAAKSAELSHVKNEGNIREHVESTKHKEIIIVEDDREPEVTHAKEEKTSVKEKDRENVEKKNEGKEKKDREPNYKAFRSLRNIRRFGEPELLPKILPKPEPIVIPRYNPSDSIPKPAEVFLYKPFVPLPDLAPYFGKPIEIHIACEYLSNLNKAYRKKLIWGSEVYTSSTDIVCALQHSGLLKMESTPPPDIGGLVVFCTVVKNNSGSKRVLSNGIYSREPEGHEEYGVRLEKIKALEYMRPVRELVRMASMMTRTTPKTFQKDIPVDAKSVIVPPEAKMVFNLSMEPVHKFTLPSFADYDRKFDQRTFSTFCKSCLYFEAGQRRFELYRDVRKDFFNLSEVKEPIHKDSRFMENSIIPLPKDCVVPMVNKKKWSSFRWGTNCTLAVKGVVIVGICNFKFYPVTKIRKHSV